MIATAGTAIGVFFVAFFAVSAAVNDSNTAAIDASVSPEAGDPAPPTGVVAEPSTEDAEEPQAEAQEPETATPSESTEPETPPPPPPIPELTPNIERFGLPIVDLPELEEDSLIHGGDGAQGAILGGAGIAQRLRCRSWKRHRRRSCGRRCFNRNGTWLAGRVRRST
jgi:hypothetical protein